MAGLDNSPGKPADNAALGAAEVRATVEDEEDVAEAMRLDRRDVMTASIIDSIVEKGNDSGSQGQR